MTCVDDGDFVLSFDLFGEFEEVNERREKKYFCCLEIKNQTKMILHWTDRRSCFKFTSNAYLAHDFVGTHELMKKWKEQ